jgi:hypothetical protein
VRDRKPSDSPSDYDREIQPRRRLVFALGDHEKRIRRLTDERWQRRVDPLMNTSSEPSADFEGCTD